jgi:hypothetical protein
MEFGVFNSSHPSCKINSAFGFRELHYYSVWSYVYIPLVNAVE